MMIEHIDQVLPSLAGRSEFIVKRTKDYTVIDYVYAIPDTFDDPVRLECRGLKFAPDGAILARPFHKFFNLGERPETQPELIDVSRPHVVMDKLDGSMIHPAEVGGEIVLMTRMGVTDVAEKAADIATQAIIDWCRGMLADGITPIFEFTAPDNRIVVAYSNPEMTLLALRDTKSGLYLSLEGVKAPVPVIAHGDSIADLNGFVRAARGLQNAEGYVIRFDDGLMLKIKADEYVLRHRSKSAIDLEKNALRAVLENADDDLHALLAEHDAAALRAYGTDVRDTLVRLVQHVTDMVERSKGMDRKTFALENVPKLPELLRPAAFVAYSGGDARSAFVSHIVRQISSGPKVEAVRAALGLPSWHDYWRPTNE